MFYNLLKHVRVLSFPRFSKLPLLSGNLPMTSTSPKFRIMLAAVSLVIRPIWKRISSLGLPKLVRIWASWITSTGRRIKERISLHLFGIRSAHRIPTRALAYEGTSYASRSSFVSQYRMAVIMQGRGCRGDPMSRPCGSGMRTPLPENLVDPRRFGKIFTPKSTIVPVPARDDSPGLCTGRSPASFTGGFTHMACAEEIAGAAR